MGKYEISDIHAHIFPGKIREKAVKSIGGFYGVYDMQCEGSAEDLINVKNEAGIGTCAIHSVATVPRQVKNINDYIYNEMNKYPDDLIGFGTIHPQMEDISEEIERIIYMGFKGIKLHPDFQQVNVDSDDSMRMFSLIKGRLPILIHLGDAVKIYSKPGRFAEVVKAFPNQIFIGAHLGGYQAWDDAEEYLIGKANIYIDTSSSLFAMSPERATRIIRNHGADNVVFGTDYPMWNPNCELERFMKLDLTETERKKILSGNFKKLFG